MHESGVVTMSKIGKMKAIHNKVCNIVSWITVL